MTANDEMNLINAEVSILSKKLFKVCTKNNDPKSMILKSLDDILLMDPSIL